MAAKTHFGFARRHPVWTGLGLTLLVLLIALALLLFNLHWVRGPLERVVSSQLEREFRVGHIDLRWGGQPTLRLDDVSLGNVPGGSEAQMASIWGRSASPCASSPSRRSRGFCRCVRPST